ncbi:TPA: DUF302 domain-containing protein [Legionella pneumophila subsp. pneumophila]|nr:DUF302 domain-containing protein [Legionella pneumophila]HAT9353321.1 DUF302 domain-containing protein [Legionella pneumophila subsp. pneumophila]HAT3871079.1 DUF302 domain-containing protein [Legionella pneumophila]HAT8702157.1 DUF302 domain-containing protein [Legionella pneumophila]HAT9368492.1 DUF302 domain-containing protein [Legionella pneumophila subsp. pneumophila]
MKTQKLKLNQEIPIYQIIGACNPQLAHRESKPSIHNRDAWEKYL